MKALVTGASGFIGSTLIEELGTLGFQVTALLRRTSDPSNLSGLRFARAEGDLSDPDSLKRAVRGMDYVFHLAGVTTASSRTQFVEANARGTERLADAVAQANPGLARFVYVSSLAAAGPARGPEPLTEDHPERPVSGYGESKLAGERALLRHRGTYPISIVRPPMVYGPRDRLFFSLIHIVSRNLLPVVRGATADGEKYYSLVHVRDLCRGLVQSALVPREKIAPAEVFYVAGDGVQSYGEMMAAIADELGREPLRVRIPGVALRAAATALSAASLITRKTFPLNLDKLNEVLPDYWICSNRKAKELLGFRPEYDIRSGMNDAIAWYKKQNWL